MIRAILFDFNGVLLDDEPLHYDLMKELLEGEGLGLEEAEYWDVYVGFDDREAFRYAFSQAGRTLADDLLARMIARKAVLYRERIEERGFPFFPGAVELIAGCHAAGLRLGVVSGALRSEIVTALQRADATGFFGPIVSADDVETSKPNPEGYVKGIAELNQTAPLPERLIHPHEILSIEDTPAGLEAAEAAGLRRLAVEHTFAAAKISSLAEHTVARISDVSVADLERLFSDSN